MRLKSVFFCATWLFSSHAWAARAAESVSVVLLQPDLSPERQRKLVLATESALKQLSNFEIVSRGSASLVAASPESRKNCLSDRACVFEQARFAGTQHVLVLSARSFSGSLQLEGVLIELASRQGERQVIQDSNLTEPESAVRGLVDKVLPGWARKGWGGLKWISPSRNDGARIRVDGKTLDSKSLVYGAAVTAGQHDVDVLLPDGSAVLQKLEVPEGGRLALSAAALPQLEYAAYPAGRSSDLRTASFGIFGAGALAIAGSLIAGALSRQAMSGAEPCVAADRSCASFAQAQSQRSKSESLALTGNVLLGVGGGLAAAGLGLFAFDAFQPQSEALR